MGKLFPWGTDEHIVLWNLESLRERFDQRGPEGALNQDEGDGEFRIFPVDDIHVLSQAFGNVFFLLVESRLEKS